MNLYLVLAIALGAITGVVEAPVARPVQLVTASERRVERCAIRIATRSRTPRSTVFGWAGLRLETWSLRPFAIAVPRAPALA